MEHVDLLVQFLVLIGSATIIATLCYYAHVPTIVGFIIAGMVIGPYGLGLVSSVPGAEMLSEIGIVLLMFTIGLEFSFEKLKQLRKAFLGIGVTQVLGTLVISATIFHWAMDYSYAKAIFLGCLLSLSSTAIVMKLLQNSRQMVTPYGTATTGVLLCQDLAVIPMMLAIPFMVGAAKITTSVDLPSVGIWLGQVLGVSLLLWFGARTLIPFMLDKVVKTRSRELFFFSMVLLCFGVAAATHSMGLSLAFGAFLAGLMISESPYGRQATADIVPMRDNFLGMSFASVGMLVDIKFMAFKFHWIVVAVLSLFIIKSGLIYVSGLLSRYPAKTSFITSLMLFQVGEFSFILAQTGLSNQIITKEELQFFLAVSVLTMMMTPYMFQLAPRLAMSKTFAKLSETPELPKGVERIVSTESLTNQPKTLHQEQSAHTIIIGFGVAGQNLAAVLSSLEIPYAVIEQNYEVVKKFQQQGMKIFYGDASRSEILHEAGLDTAKLVVVSVSGKHMTRAVAEKARIIRPDIDIIARVQYLLNAKELADLQNTQVVVAENETTIELLARALAVYGVGASSIEQFMAETRQKLRGTALSFSDSMRKKVDLPAWDVLGSIRPVVIREDFKCSGKTIAELQLRPQTGATIIAVFRESLGTAIPKGDFVLEKGDVLHLIGDADAHEKAEQVLHFGLS